MGVVESVNVGVVRPLTPKVGSSGIDKRSADGPVLVRAPGPKRGVSGLVTDQIASAKFHGGNDQAVYAYAREDLAFWQAELDRPLAAGAFGENLTTVGVDVTGALAGEHWEIGAELVLQVSVPRIPCATFAARMAVPRWVRTFTARATPGAYLRVLRPGLVAAGDRVVVTNRPAHDVTIGLMFRALTTEPDLLSRLAVVSDLPAGLRTKVRRRSAAVS
ncbi:MAG TPA: MOSC domain-containing protein [Pseudonocardiaceae bacterium]|nr:MOSC domain-containing protein [Pseudonocardiaceae bacterium]